MKKLFFALMIVSALGFSNQASAQVVVDGVNINNLELISMIRMIVQGRFLSNRINVFIDYGQSVGGAARQRMEVVDPRTDKRIPFNSVMHAVNYMLDNNWEYVESMVLPSDGSASTTSTQYIFRRKAE